MSFCDFCSSKGSLCNDSVSQFSHSVMSNSLRLHQLQKSQKLIKGEIWVSSRSWSLTQISPLMSFCDFSNSWSLLKLMSIESVMPSKHLILCLSLFLLPSIFPSIRVFSNESMSFFQWVLYIRWPKYWSLSFSISPSNVYLGWISFRIDWFDLAVQVTLKSLLQNHSSKASILQCSVFFMVQLSHLYMTTGKTIALTKWTFVGKVMSLLCNILSRFIIALVI